MVHLDKIPGQLGHMVIQEDGSVLSSSGELASSESTSQHILNMVANAFSANFSTVATTDNGESFGADETRDGVNGHHSSACANGNGDTKPFKWNRLTVSFGDKSYVACLSNRKIHVVKRDLSTDEL